LLNFQRRLGGPKGGAGLGMLHCTYGTQVAVLFGNERSGLSNEELKRCTETVAIPTAAVPSANPKDPLVQSSLNLSHAVTVLCYEVRCAFP